MTTWELKETPAGCGYELRFDGVARVGEAVDFGYVATLDTGTLDVPDSVVVTLADTEGDTTSAVTATGTVAGDTNGYAVSAVLPTTTTAALSAGDYVYEVKELRDTNASFPFGGCFSFTERVEG